MAKVELTVQSQMQRNGHFLKCRKLLDGLSTNGRKANSNKKATVTKSVSKITEYPSGIDSIKLGDSKKTVFGKIKQSEHITFADYCEDHSFNEWLEKLEDRSLACPGLSIKLFTKEFDIEWKFSKNDKLFDIVLGKALVALEYSHDNGLSSRKKAREFCKYTTQGYSQKYGEPKYYNVSEFAFLLPV